MGWGLKNSFFCVTILRVGSLGQATLTPLKDQEGKPTRMEGAAAQTAFQFASMDLASSKGSQWSDPKLRQWEGDLGDITPIQLERLTDTRTRRAPARGLSRAEYHVARGRPPGLAMTKTIVDALLRRDRAIVITAPTAISVLAWAYVLWLVAQMTMMEMPMPAVGGSGIAGTSMPGMTMPGYFGDGRHEHRWQHECVAEPPSGSGALPISAR